MSIIGKKAGEPTHIEIFKGKSIQIMSPLMGDVKTVTSIGHANTSFLAINWGRGSPRRGCGGSREFGPPPASPGTEPARGSPDSVKRRLWGKNK